MLYEERVQRNPELPVHELSEGGLGLLGGPGADDAEAIRDPMHVRVDRDRGDPVAEDEHAVRGLRPDPGKRGQLLERPRDPPPEPLEDRSGAVADHPRLDAIEPGRPDQGLDRVGAGPRERDRGREGREEAGARDVRVRVARPLREDRPDQHLERVLGVVAQVRPPPVAGPVEGGEAVEDSLPVGPGESRAAVHAPGLARSGGRPAGGATAGRSAAGPRPGSERSGSSASGFRTSSPMR